MTYKKYFSAFPIRMLVSLSTEKTEVITMTEKTYQNGKALMYIYRVVPQILIVYASLILQL